jgi:transposase InsO family protein
MTLLPQRQNIMTLIEQAVKQGARWQTACRICGLSVRTVRRWKRTKCAAGDRRTTDLRKYVRPSNALSAQEQQQILSTLNSEEFRDLPPTQVVPILADRNIYLGSESTMYRVLRHRGQLTHRRAERAPQPRSKPRALQATAPNQLYSWDITYLPTQIQGQYFYLYLFVDIFSRYVVGWQVFECESAELGSALLQDICLQQGIHANQLTLHSDNGSPMKGEIMQLTLQRLGVAHTRSRPAVSNDNPYSEALFKTLKYRPQYPVQPFADIVAARHWVTELVRWYNYSHRHSAIGFVTPEERHTAKDKEILQRRSQLYTHACQANPQRWSVKTRNWQFINVAHLNPDTPNKGVAIVN